jgi:MFS family permease
VSTSAVEAGASYRSVLSNRESRSILLAQGTSDLGDQIARVALALLVLGRTQSVFYAAVTLAVAYVPGIFGTAFLGSLADRLPRRALMLWCDLGRAALISALALLAGNGIPLAVLLVLLLVSETLSAPFVTARGAMLPDVLPQRSLYITAQGMSRSLSMLSQVVGFALGGAVVALVGARTALVADALTFLVSYALVRWGVTPRPAVAGATASVRLLASDLAAGARELFSDPARRMLITLGWGSSFFLIAPEAVALAYRPDDGPFIAGLLLAAVPAGSAVGILLMPKMPYGRQVDLLLTLAALSCLPLFATSINPPSVVAGALWFLSGALQAYMLTVITTVTLMTDMAWRGRVLGIAAAGFNAATAVSFALVGWLGVTLGPARAVSLAGAAGLGLLLGLRFRWPRERIIETAGNA